MGYRARQFINPRMKRVVRYYVDATKGNDGNSGLSPGNAWQTLDPKVNGETFLPGEHVMLQGLFREQLTVPSSGVFGSPITISVYGTGATISGADIKTVWAVYAGTTYETALTTDPLQTFMDDVRLIEGTDRDSLNDHEWVWAADVLYVRDDTGDPDVTGVVIEASRRNNCVYATDKTHVTIDSVDMKSARARNVRFDASEGITLRNFETSFPYRSSVYLAAAAAFLISNVIAHSAQLSHSFDCRNATSGRVVRSTMFNEPQQGVHLNLADSIIVEYCTMFDMTDGGTEGTGVGGDSYSNCLIQWNEMWNCNNAAVDMSGTDTPVQDNIVRYNIMHDCVGARALLVYAASTVGYLARRNKVYYNLFYSNSKSIQVTGRAQDNEFYNNVLYNPSDQNLRVSSTGGVVPTNNKFKNNISFTLTNWHVVETDGEATNVWDNNCYHDDGAGRFSWNSSGVADFAAWQTASGEDGDSIADNPDMVNPDAQDFHLQDVSPCRNAGEDVGLVLDYYGVPVPQESNPAIGVAEYEDA